MSYPDFRLVLYGLTGAPALPSHGPHLSIPPARTPHQHVLGESSAGVHCPVLDWPESPVVSPPPPLPRPLSRVEAAPGDKAPVFHPRRPDIIRALLSRPFMHITTRRAAYGAEQSSLLGPGGPSRGPAMAPCYLVGSG